MLGCDGMYKKEEIEDSLEFCKGISFYETGTFPVTSEKVIKEKKTEQKNKIAEEEVVEKEETFSKLILLRITEAIVCVAIAFVIATLLNNYVGSHTRVDGNSMETTLQNGDYLLVDKLSYIMGEPKRFDIIVFQHDEENYYIKRIIGMPGDRIQIIEGNVFVNGSILKENYGQENMEEGGLANKEIKVGSDEYFVLGDNRNHSNDSRFEVVGNVKKSLIVGKVVYRVLPIEKFGKLNQ